MLKKTVTYALAGMAFIAGVAISQPGYAQQTTVLVMGEDWDEDTIPRNSRVFNGVMDALERRMVRGGYGVVNETMATLGNFEQGRVRRSDAELYDIAKSINEPPIDVIVTFKIYPRFQRTGYSTKVNAELTGKVLSASKNQVIDNFQVKLPQDANAPKDCNRDCAVEVMGEYTRILGQDLGEALTRKLKRYTREANAGSATAGTTSTESAISRAYILEFNDFNASQRGEIEEYLAAFSGYQHHRIVGEGSTYGKYWYETTAEDGKVKRNLRKMMEYLGLEARVSCAATKCTIDLY